jgi:hypothetical protein
MKIFTTLFILFTSLISAQSISIRGVVADSTTKEPLVGANIILYRLSDSTMNGTASNSKGEFLFESLRPGAYSLNISYLGYKPLQIPLRSRNSVDLGRVYISKENLELQGVEVVDKLIPVIEKDDTTEIMADAFKVSKDADAEALVSKMPGITVQDGKVQAQGEDVRRVLVDGRPFFGDDPTAVLRNIPAEMIERIQVFDEQSEQSQFTGFDDGNTSRTINLITRNRIRQGTFGRASAGYGNQDKYRAGGSVNFFQEDSRLTLIGQLNNINELNFSSEDLAGLSAMSGRGMGRRGGGGGGGRGGWSGGLGGGANTSDFTVNTRNGLTATKAFGLNYSDKWGESINLTGSYFFNLTDNNALSSLNREYFFPVNNPQSYFENSNATANNLNHRFNMRLEYQIDSLNSLMFRPRFTYQKNDGNSFLYGITETEENILNILSNDFNTELSGLSSSAELLYRRRFETKGRTVSLSLNGGYNNNNGNNHLISDNILFNELQQNPIYLDQTSELTSNGKSGSANLVFTEALGENSILQLNSRYSVSKDESDQLTFADKNLDTSLSNIATKDYITQTYGAGYRYQKEGISYNINLNYNIASLYNDRIFPYLTRVEKNFHSLLPSFMLRFGASRDQNLRINYRGSNNDPSVVQLQDVLNNNNPVQLSIGNPDLKQDYRHIFSIRYSEMSMTTLHSFFILLNGTITNDYIGNTTIIANKDTIVFGNIPLYRGTQISRPENLNGFMNFRSLFTYSLPVEFLKSNLNLNVAANYSKTPGIINRAEGFTNNLGYGLGFILSSNFSELIDFTLSSQSSFSDVRSTLRTNLDNNYFTQNLRGRIQWQFWDGVVINNDFRYQYNSRLPNDADKHTYLWNFSLGKKLFADNSGEVRLTAYDILNKENNLRRNTTDTYFEDIYGNSLGRYFMVSFIYNLRSFGGGESY